MTSKRHVPVDEVLARAPMPAYTPLRPDPAWPRAGYVYVMVHPAWPSFAKVGHTVAPKKRLSSANTHCPQGNFEFALVETFDDRTAAEAEVHSLLGDSYRRLYGEWFECPREAAIEAVFLVARKQRKEADEDASSRRRD